MFGDQARIIRWDRTGALVTELFSWTQGTISYNFFSHFNEASAKQRGVGTAVRPALLEEVNKAKAAFKQAGLGDTNSMTRPHYLYQVPTQTPPAPNPSYAPFGSFLAGRPSVWSHSFTGRASAGYICWDVATGSVHFMKDAWRDVTNSVDEPSIYRLLNDRRPDSGGDPTDGEEEDFFDHVVRR